MINNCQNMTHDADLLCPQVHFSDYKPVEFCSREWKKIYHLVDSSEKFITPKMTLHISDQSRFSIKDKKTDLYKICISCNHTN